MTQEQFIQKYKEEWGNIQICYTSDYGATIIEQELIPEAREYPTLIGIYTIEQFAEIVPANEYERFLEIITHCNEGWKPL